MAKSENKTPKTVAVKDAVFKKIKDIDYRQTIRMPNIAMPKDLFEKEKQRYIQQNASLPSAQRIPEEKIPQMIQQAFMQRNVLEAIKTYIRPCFSFTPNPAEKEAVLAQIKANAPANLDNSKLSAIADNMIFEKPLMEFFSNEWKITVSDEDVENFLLERYRKTNESIRDIKNDKEKCEQIKKQLVLQKTVAQIPNYFHVTMEVDLTPGMPKDKKI